MKILHVVTLLSADGAFGGPARVALNQASALKSLGHDVLVVAGTRGYPLSLEELNGVPVRLFRLSSALGRQGFAWLYSLQMLVWLRRHRHEFDAIHIHLARDLVTLPASLVLLSQDYVAQTHGMIDSPTNPLAKLIDILVRPALRSARVVFCLTPTEEEDIRAISRGKATVAILPNGVPASTEKRAPIMAGDVPEVLFLGRMHSRKRPTLFVEMAGVLHERGVPARFALVGPDEGEAPGVVDLISEMNLHESCVWEGAIEASEVASRIAESAVFVMTAEAEPFGMTILEAMAVHRPVVLSATAALAPLISERRAGVVVIDDPHEYADAVQSLLENRELEIEITANADRLLTERFGMNGVATTLLSRYRTGDRTN